VEAFLVPERKFFGYAGGFRRRSVAKCDFAALYSIVRGDKRHAVKSSWKSYRNKCII
jgi:hypothetical protein